MFYQSRNDIQIATLLPVVQAKVKQLVQNWEQKGRQALITEGYRSPDQQHRDWESGRLLPGRIITNADANQSLHQFRVAFDFVPCDAKGNLNWGNLLLFRSYAQDAQALGFEWGGSWLKFRDYPHLQFTQGHPLSFFQNGGVL